MTAKTYAILNYGCQMNESDAEHYAGQLQELGYKAAEDFHDADVVVVNTCCVRESAEKRILGKIGELKGVKANHPGQIVCVALFITPCCCFNAIIPQYLTNVNQLLILI